MVPLFKKRLFGIAVSFLVALTVSMPVKAAVGDWSVYTSMQRVNAVLSRGNEVWGATSGGVFRFNLADSSYTRYTTLQGLSGNNVLCMAEDSTGNIWFGTNGDGLSIYSATERMIQPVKAFQDIPVNALLIDGDKIYVATSNSGISLYIPSRNEIKETYHLLGDFSRNVEVLSLALIDGKLWAATSEGIAYADTSQPNLLDPTSWDSDNSVGYVWSIAFFDSTVFLGTQYGVIRQHGHLWMTEDMPRAKVYEMTVYNNRLVAATSIGLFTRLSIEWTRERQMTESVLSLNVSSEGVLWIGSAYLGLLKWENGILRKIPKMNEPYGNTFTSLALDKDGNLWTATAQRQTFASGIYRYDGENWIPYSKDNGLGSNAVVSVKIDSKGRIWVGTWGGGAALFVPNNTSVQKGSFKKINNTNSVLNPTDTGKFLVVNDISFDRGGNVWMSNFISNQSTLQVPTSGLVVIDGYPNIVGQIFTPGDGLPSGQGTAVSVDSSGTVWFGTLDLGIAVLDYGNDPFDKSDDVMVPITTSSHKDLTSNNIRTIAVDRKGTVWVGTDVALYGIIGKLDRDSKTFRVDDWKTYTVSTNGLANGIINAIVADSENNIWVGTQDGLSKISSDGNTVVNFTRSNSPLLDNAVIALTFNEKTGDLWIGTLRGLNRLETAISSNKPSISSIKIFPNPFILSDNDPQLVLAGLPDRAIVRIYTVAGELVKTISGNDLQTGKIIWNGRNEDGRLVSSGVYFFTVTDDKGNVVRGKFAVLP